MVIVGLRRLRGAAAAVVAALLLTCLAGVGRSAADGCADVTRLFAVDAGTGHLAELPYCPGAGKFLPATDVDGADRRPYRDVVAAQDGGIAVVYAVTWTASCGPAGNRRRVPRWRRRCGSAPRSTGHATAR